MSFTLEIKADNADDLRAALTSLADAFGGAKTLGAHVQQAVLIENGVRATMSAPETETEKVEVQETLPAEDKKLPPGNVVKDMSVTEQREAGIKMLMQLYNAAPEKMPQITALQTKFGVKMFKDLPDDKVPEFYHDALLVVNGTPVQIDAAAA